MPFLARDGGQRATYWERPETFNRLVDDFLRDVDGAIRCVTSRTGAPPGARLYSSGAAPRPTSGRAAVDPHDGPTREGA